MDLNLTKRQSEIFDFIKGHLDKTGYPPTVREIGSALGLHSPSTVHARLAKRACQRGPDSAGTDYAHPRRARRTRLIWVHTPVGPLRRR